MARSAPPPQATGAVVAVHRSPRHTMAKAPQPAIELLAGIGVAGDAHAGSTVKHRSRVRRDATQPNLRQVHLVHRELNEELRAAGFAVDPGAMGENVTTADIDLLALSTGTRLHLGPRAVVEVTGLRNPCRQLDGIHQGLMAAVLGTDATGAVVRKAGVMAVVVEGGTVRPGDPVTVELPVGEPVPLAPV